MSLSHTIAGWGVSPKHGAFSLREAVEEVWRRLREICQLAMRLRTQAELRRSATEEQRQAIAEQAEIEREMWDTEGRWKLALEVDGE